MPESDAASVAVDAEGTGAEAAGDVAGTGEAEAAGDVPGAGSLRAVAVAVTVAAGSESVFVPDAAVSAALLLFTTR